VIGPELLRNQRMPSTSREELATLLVHRLAQSREALAESWRNNTQPFRYLVVDDVLPEETAAHIPKVFPKPETMVLKDDLRERKRITAQLDQCHPLLLELTYAFQDTRFLEMLSGITGIQPLLPDASLYAGGISLMQDGDFLSPHIDNSHDVERQKYRVLNLLYYVSPGWHLACGGNLELWDKKVTLSTTLVSRYNRLVMIETHRQSWHSVSPITVKKDRCCISNYYFSERSLTGEDYFHVTSFTGWPHEKLKRKILYGDRVLRMALRKCFPKGWLPTNHIFKNQTTFKGGKE